MSPKRIIVGQQAWIIPGDAAEVLVQVESALKDGSVLRLTLLDDANREVEVFINGRNVESLAVDLGAGPRPSEIFGTQTTDGSTTGAPTTTSTSTTGTPTTSTPTTSAPGTGTPTTG